VETSSQQISCHQKTSARLTAGQRILAGSVLPAIVVIFALLHVAAVHNLVFYPWQCGFKAQFGLPCPTCGMTTSVLAFARGDILKSFYIQPAAAALCCLLMAIGTGGLAVAISGTDWGLVRGLKLKYIIVMFMVLIGGGWAVTLARAIADRIQP
jgi:hypothetical protein